MRSPVHSFSVRLGSSGLRLTCSRKVTEYKEKGQYGNGVRSGLKNTLVGFDKIIWCSYLTKEYLDLSPLFREIRH